MIKEFIASLLVTVAIWGGYQPPQEPVEFGATIAMTRQGGTSTSSPQTGAILYGDANNFWVGLPPGAESEVLTISSGLPVWSAAAGGAGGYAEFTQVGDNQQNVSTTPFLFTQGIYASSTALLTEYINYGSGTSTATSTSRGLKVENLISCDTIDTTAEGHFVCGTDDGGGGTNDWEVVWGNDSPTLRPTSTNDLTGLFINASSTIAANFRVDGSASTTATTTARGFKAENLISCDTIDTTAEGHFICGTDETGAGGGIATIKENNVQVGDADISILDFLGAQFDLAESPDQEINIELAVNVATSTHPGGFTVDGNSTSTTSIWVGTAGTANNLDLTGGDLYVQDDLEVDGSIFTADAQITGGTITGITDLVVADGGTGASTLSAGDILLGNGTSAIQATSTLSVVKGGTGAATHTLGELLLGGGTSPFTSTSTLSVVSGGTGATSHTAGSLLLGGGTSPFTSTSTLSIVSGGTGATSLSAGDIIIGGGTSPLTASSTLSVVKGGTGATSLTDGGVLLGSGTSPVTAMSVLGDGVIIVGDNATDPTTIQLLTSSTGLVRHEVGGIELDISSIGIGDILAGVSAGTVEIVDGGAASDGDVLTIQADGTVEWEVASGGGTNDWRVLTANAIGYLTPTTTKTLHAPSNFLIGTTTETNLFYVSTSTGTLTGLDRFAVIASTTNSGIRPLFEVSDEITTSTPQFVVGQSNVAGDSEVGFFDNGVHVFTLGNDDSENLFTISSGDELGTSNMFTLDSSGNNTTTGWLNLGATNGLSELLSSGDLYVGDGATVTNSLTVASFGAGFVESDANGLLSIGTINLGTDTDGAYVATIADAGNSTITVVGSGGETAAVTLDAVDLNCTNCIGETEISDVYLLNNADDSTTFGLTIGSVTSTDSLSVGGYASSTSLFVGTNAESRFSVNSSGVVTAGTWNGTAIDISDYTNLAVSSPITLTDDTVGFDFTTNNTWSGNNIFTGEFVVNNASSTIDSTLTIGGNATSSGWFNIGSTDVVGTLGSLIGAGDLFVGDAATTTGNLWVGNTTNGGFFDIADGGWKHFGTARPKRSIVLTAGGATPTIGDSGSATTTQATVLFTTNRQSFVILDFPNQPTTSTAQWMIQMPDDYDGGTFDATLMHTATTSGQNAGFAIRAISYADDDAMDNSSWGNWAAWSNQGVATIDDFYVSTSTTVTAGNTPAAGETVLFELARGANTNDDRDNQARVIQVKLEYTITGESE